MTPGPRGGPPAGRRAEQLPCNPPEKYTYSESSPVGFWYFIGKDHKFSGPYRTANDALRAQQVTTC